MLWDKDVVGRGCCGTRMWGIPELMYTKHTPPPGHLCCAGATGCHQNQIWEQLPLAKRPGRGHPAAPSPHHQHPAAAATRHRPGCGTGQHRFLVTDKRRIPHVHIQSCAMLQPLQPQLERMPLHPPKRKRPTPRPPSLQVCGCCLSLPQGRCMHDGGSMPLFPWRV